MTRVQLLTWLEAALAERGIPARRYSVEVGLEDLELQLDGVTHRIRTLRTGQH